MESLSYEMKSAFVDPDEERARRVAMYAAQVNAKGDGSKAIKENRQGHMARPVYCVELGREFDNAGHAARILNLKTSNIRQAIRKNATTAGKHFRYIEGAPMRPVHHSRCRQVECVETLIPFATMSDAARANGLPTSTMFDAVRFGKPCQVGDRVYHFRYRNSEAPCGRPGPYSPRPMIVIEQMEFNFAAATSAFAFSA